VSGIRRPPTCDGTRLLISGSFRLFSAAAATSREDHRHRRSAQATANGLQVYAAAAIGEAERGRDEDRRSPNNLYMSRTATNTSAGKPVPNIDPGTLAGTGTPLKIMVSLTKRPLAAYCGAAKNGKAACAIELWQGASIALAHKRFIAHFLPSPLRRSSASLLLLRDAPVVLALSVAGIWQAGCHRRANRGREGLLFSPL
jgi:hypothetical protein